MDINFSNTQNDQFKRRNKTKNKLKLKSVFTVFDVVLNRRKG